MNTMASVFAQLKPNLGVFLVLVACAFGVELVQPINTKVRIRELNPRTPKGTGWKNPRNPVIIGLGLVGGVVVLLALRTHLLVLVALALVGFTAITVVKDIIAMRAHTRIFHECAHALMVLEGELHAGASMREGLKSSSAVIRDPTVRQLVETASLRAEMDSEYAAETLRESTIEPLRYLGAGWMLSQRHGMCLSSIIALTRARIDARITVDRKMNAALQGPLVTAGVLACLPLLGMGLGLVMGINTLNFLLNTFLGNVIFLLGVSAECAGIFWSRRIITGVKQS
ncbi:hypothetical protein P4N68_06130 [Corynebacterium felinum]|uniref:Tight adherence protein B n=1 Tax=Corynebacterium felinum TaxID=131318 RepID=A0ABU2B6R5_9CORY|nr:hypothetical protein [Corynebacterium felinum]MDF5820657.1 hypothetical protein [Corynebacterium felinum]MDR7354096.1 tight adherence protein B [Corynebacterium felinum]WJY96268.1 hypothetical protein CFELI_13445 [Corynebacterium felinum]